MTHVDWVKRLAEGMRQLHNEFDENELAYLALTSKVERPVVDRLAYKLYRDCRYDDRVGIAREYTDASIRRVDLAIVADNIPLLFLEAKALTYRFAYSQTARNEYRNKICGDIQKLKRYVPRSPDNGTKKLSLLLATHFDGDVDCRFSRVIKYPDRIKKLSSVTLAYLEDKIDDCFGQDSFPLRASGNIVGGKVYNMKVTIHYRLLGPF